MAASLSSSSSSLCPSLSLSSSSLLTPATSFSVVATTTSRNVGRRGARAAVQSQQDWAMGNGKKVKNHGIVHCVVHDFYVKINPGQKSGDAVACANVAPVRLHCLICHKGINTWQIIAQQRKNGGGGLITLLAFGRSLPTSPVLGIIFRRVGRHPKNNFGRRQQDHKSGCGEKLRETKNN